MKTFLLAACLAAPSVSFAAALKSVPRLALAAEPVSMALPADRLEALRARHPREEAGIAEVVKLFQAVEATRSVRIVSSKSAVVSVVEGGASGLEAKGRSRANTETESGRAALARKTDAVVRAFQDSVLARSEAQVFDGAALRALPGFISSRVEEGIPGHAMPYMRERHVIARIRHPNDIVRAREIPWVSGGLPVVYEFESEDGVPTIGVRLEKR
jgi:hypothetical protein